MSLSYAEFQMIKNPKLAEYKANEEFKREYIQAMLETAEQRGYNIATNLGMWSGVKFVSPNQWPNDNIFCFLKITPGIDTMLDNYALGFSGKVYANWGFIDTKNMSDYGMDSAEIYHAMALTGPNNERGSSATATLNLFKKERSIDWIRPHVKNFFANGELELQRRIELAIIKGCNNP